MELDPWTQALVAAMTTLWSKIAGFIPNLFVALVLVLLGFVVAKLLDTSQGGLYSVFRKCALAVLNCGSSIDDGKELLERYSSFDISIIQRERGTAAIDLEQVEDLEIGGDAGARPGTTTEESAELKKLRRENAELRRANAILKTASAFFAAELDRPHH